MTATRRFIENVAVLSKRLASTLSHDFKAFPQCVQPSWAVQRAVPTLPASSLETTRQQRAGRDQLKGGRHVSERATGLHGYFRASIPSVDAASRVFPNVLTLALSLSRQEKITGEDRNTVLPGASGLVGCNFPKEEGESIPRREIASRHSKNPERHRTWQVSYQPTSSYLETVQPPLATALSLIVWGAPDRLSASVQFRPRTRGGVLEIGVGDMAQRSGEVTPRERRRVVQQFGSFESSRFRPC